MLVKFLQKNNFFRGVVYKLSKARANDIFGKIKPFLNKKSHILDIGAGTCNVCEILLEEGYNIVPLDIQDLSFVNNIKPILYDGDKIPFDDNKFDIALILMVLHHISYPDRIIEEAKRVSRRIIIMEDIYTNIFHKYITYFLDSLLNLEFIGHPHTNKNNKLWKETFDKLGLKIVEARYSSSYLVLRHATYYLEK